jgi:hypothetical protein
VILSTLTPEIIAELKSKHADFELYKLVSEDKKYVVVVKGPDNHIWRNYLTYVSDQSLRPGALAKLVETTLVWPSHEEWAKILQEKPGLSQAFGNEICAIAGSTVNVESTKL